MPSARPCWRHCRASSTTFWRASALLPNCAACILLTSSMPKRWRSASSMTCGSKFAAFARVIANCNCAADLLWIERSTSSRVSIRRRQSSARASSGPLKPNPGALVTASRTFCKSPPRMASESVTRNLLRAAARGICCRACSVMLGSTSWRTASSIAAAMSLGSSRSTAHFNVCSAFSFGSKALAASNSCSSKPALRPSWIALERSAGSFFSAAFLTAARAANVGIWSSAFLMTAGSAPALWSSRTAMRTTPASPLLMASSAFWCASKIRNFIRASLMSVWSTRQVRASRICFRRRRTLPLSMAFSSSVFGSAAESFEVGKHSSHCASVSTSIAIALLSTPARFRSWFSNFENVRSPSTLHVASMNV
mmetsp:Transcript_88272/g.248544  ORF Transcript_88272/g.248544 Transcript_88272/m.248544 type:complete len:367 (+) Transcript_88272:98-1198(+)